MPRYYFNVFDNRSFPDSDGLELPDPAAAQVLAIHHAGEILQSDARRIAPGQDWRMEVTDERGLVLFRLDFGVTASPELGDAPASPDARVHRGSTLS